MYARRYNYSLLHSEYTDDFCKLHLAKNKVNTRVSDIRTQSYLQSYLLTTELRNVVLSPSIVRNVKKEIVGNSKRNIEAWRRFSNTGNVCPQYQRF